MILIINKNIYYLIISNILKYIITAILLTYLLLYIGCDTSEPYQHHVLVIRGTIVDSVQDNPIDSALIATFRTKDSSVVIQNDSLAITIFEHIALYVLSNGEWSLAYAAEDNPPFSVLRLIAYKYGYHVWRFNAKRDTVFHPKIGGDSVVIRMVKK